MTKLASGTYSENDVVEVYVNNKVGYEYGWVASVSEYVEDGVTYQRVCVVTKSQEKWHETDENFVSETPWECGAGEYGKKWNSVEQATQGHLVDIWNLRAVMAARYIPGTAKLTDKASDNWMEILEALGAKVDYTVSYPAYNEDFPTRYAVTIINKCDEVEKVLVTESQCKAYAVELATSINVTGK